MGNWKQATLGEICESTGGGIQTGPFGSQLHANDYVESGTPSVMPQNIGDNRIDPTGIAMVSDDDMDRLSRYKLREGDIVYSRRGDVERRALVRKENEGWLCGTGCLRVRLGSRQAYDPRFVSYALGLERSREWIRRHAVGATMLNLNTSILSSIPLDVPEIHEQRAIATVLEAIDDKIATNYRTAQLCLELADARFVAASQHVPVGDKTFGDVADVFGGGTPKSSVDDYWNGDVLWATPTDVTALSGPYLSNTSRMITEKGLAACSSKLHPTGSILMTSRATIGTFAIARAPTAVNQGFIVVNAKDQDLQWWLFHEMRSRVPEFIRRANGATFLELSRGKFKQFQVRLPEKSVIRSFSKKVDALHNLAAQSMVQTDKLAATRDGLLALLMSGKIRVRDIEKTIEEVV